MLYIVSSNMAQDLANAIVEMAASKPTKTALVLETRITLDYDMPLPAGVPAVSSTWGVGIAMDKTGQLVLVANGMTYKACEEMVEPVLMDLRDNLVEGSLWGGDPCELKIASTLSIRHADHPEERVPVRTMNKECHTVDTPEHEYWMEWITETLKHGITMRKNMLD